MKQQSSSILNFFLGINFALVLLAPMTPVASWGNEQFARAAMIPNKLERAIVLTKPRNIVELRSIRAQIKEIRKELILIPQVSRPVTPPATGKFINGLTEVRTLPVAAGESVADCELVKTGYARASELLVDLTELEDRIDTLSAQAETLAADPNSTTDQLNAVLDETGLLLDELTTLTDELAQVYPSSYGQVDRIMEYRWDLTAAQLGHPESENWFVGTNMEVDALSVPGYDWTDAFAGTISESMNLPTPPGGDRRSVVFRRFASPSDACLADFNVLMKGVIEVREPISVTPPVVGPVQPIRPINPIGPIRPHLLRDEPVRPVPPVVRPIVPVTPVRPIEPVRPIPPVRPLEPVRPIVRYKVTKYEVTFNSNRPIPLIRMRAEYVGRLESRATLLRPIARPMPIIRPISDRIIANPGLNPIITNPIIVRPVTPRPIGRLPN